MPVVAIAAAVVSDVAVGAAGFGAVLAGTATLTTTLEVVGAVGATIGAVGAVTHDKGLSTAGMIMGGIGGIGALASSAGLFGDAANTEPLFGSSSSVAATSQANLAADAGTINQLAASNAAELPGNLSSADIIGSLNPETAAAAAQAAGTTPMSSLAGVETAPVTGNTGAYQAVASTESDLPGKMLNAQGQEITPTPAAAAANTNALPPSSVMASGGTPTTPVKTPTIPGVVTPSAPLSPVTVTPESPSVQAFQKSSKGGTGGIFNWLSNTQGGALASYGLIQAAGSFLSGAFNPLTPAQVAQMNAQAAANNATAKLTTQQVANMQGPLPTVSAGTPSGIINTPPPITGVPA